MHSIDKLLQAENRIQKRISITSNDSQRLRTGLKPDSPISPDPLSPDSIDLITGSMISAEVIDCDIHTPSARPTLNRPKEEQGRRISDIQHEKVQSRIVDLKQNPPRYMEGFKFTQKAFALTKTTAFKFSFYVLICLNSMEMGLSMAYDDEKYDTLWWYADLVFATLWIVELLVLIIALGHRVFRNFWHTLSFLCTMASILDLAYRTTNLADEFKLTSHFLRLCRLLMLAKLFEINAQTKIIVAALVRSLGALQGVLVVILVACYASTLMVYSVVHRKEEEYLATDFGNLEIDFNFHTHFGNMVRTMMTLFSVLILSEWDAVARATFEVQPTFTVFWVVFTVTLTFGLTNVLVGIIVDTVNVLNQEHQATLAEAARARLQVAISQITDLIFGDDDDVEFDEFVEATKDNEMMLELLTELHVPAGFTFGDLFCVLDDDKDGHMKKAELSDGLFSLVSGNDNARFLLQSLHISRCHADIVDCRADIAEGTNSIRQELQTLATQLTAKQQSDALPRQDLTMESTPEERRTVLDLNTRPNAPHAPTSPDPNKMNVAIFSDDLWNQCYQTLHDSAAKHCKSELESAWIRLQEVYDTIKLDMSNGGLMPFTQDNIFDQEQLVVRNKLHTAVCAESPDQLRKALDHAIAIGIDSSQLNIELTYNDALKRQDRHVLPVTKVQEAMENGDWSSAFDMVIESALKFGVNKNILSHVLTRISESDVSGQLLTSSSKREDATDLGFGNQVRHAPLPSWGSSASNQEPSVAGRAGLVRQMQIRLGSPLAGTGIPNDSESQNSFHSLLQSEACKHVSEAMIAAWEDVEASGKLQARTRAQRSRDEKPSPLSRQEEAFFVCNQLYCAVQQRSLADLQRAIGQAMAAGLDMRHMDSVLAYRDALTRYHKGGSYIIRLAVDALKRREWYLALDLLVQVSLARGCDRQSLLRAISKVYADNRMVKGI